jgi:hypothetical protein
LELAFDAFILAVRANSADQVGQRLFLAIMAMSPGARCSAVAAFIGFTPEAFALLAPGAGPDAEKTAIDLLHQMGQAFQCP